MKYFRLNSSLLISLLVVLLGYNIYCLKSLYDSISHQTKELIIQSLKDADLDEVLNRANKYPPPDSIPTYKGKTMSQSRNIKGDTLYVTIKDSSDSITAIRKLPLPPGTNYSDIMVNEICYGAHETIDPIYKFRLADLDSLFRLSLSRKGIMPKEIAVIRISEEGIITAGKRPLRHIEHLDSISICYNVVTGDRYIAYYSPPEKYIFRQMQGVIFSTAAIIILLATAFGYLLRTVSKLRTLEEMKDDFVSNMTHELKTPIAIAYAANDALLHYNHTNDSSKKETYLKISLKQLNRLGGLVENILAMSMEQRKAMRFKPECIDLAIFLEELRAAYMMKSDKEVEIITDIHNDAIVTADKAHLTNVVGNLLDNAIKYSGESVKITITATSRILSVTDNGIGIPAKSIPFLFNKFYRVPHGNIQDVRGYGIGLYYVKNIIQKMGWSISVESTFGEGSVFTIRFKNDDEQ